MPLSTTRRCLSSRPIWCCPARGSGTSLTSLSISFSATAHGAPRLGKPIRSTQSLASQMSSTGITHVFYCFLLDFYCFLLVLLVLLVLLDFIVFYLFLILIVSMQEVVALLKTIQRNGNPYFKLYAFVGLMKVRVMVGQFTEAIEEVQMLKLSDQKILCESFNCYLSFYYYLAYAYLMKGSYKEAANILESLILFTNKYKQFCSK